MDWKKVGLPLPNGDIFFRRRAEPQNICVYCDISAELLDQTRIEASIDVGMSLQPLYKATALPRRLSGRTFAEPDSCMVMAQTAAGGSIDVILPRGRPEQLVE